MDKQSGKGIALFMPAVQSRKKNMMGGVKGGGSVR